MSTVNSRPSAVVVVGTVLKQFFSVRPQAAPPRKQPRSRALLAFLPATLLTVAASGALSFSLQQQHSENELRRAFQRNASLLTELTQAAASTESAHRGFMLGGAGEHLDDYQRGARQVWAAYGELRHQNLAIGGDASRVEALIETFQAWQDRFADPSLEAHRRGEATVDPSQAAALMEALAHRAALLRGESDVAASSHARAAEAAEQRSWWLALLSPLVVFCSLLIASLWFGLRTRRALQSLRAVADRLADGDLDARADRQADAALTGSLALAFNGMAEQFSERTRKTALLADIAETLQACTSFDEACGVLATVAPRLLPESSGRLSVFNASRNAVVPVTAWGDPTSSTDGFDPDDCWSLRKGRVHLYQPPRHGIACNHVDGESSSRAQVCIPMTAQGDPVGVLHLEFSGVSPQRVNASIELASIAAERFALALANLRLRDSLRDRSIRDPLTGLFNRRYLEETLDREFGRAQRGDQALTMLVIDVDHFKRFNDQHGHEAGDTVLAHMGRLLKDFFRTSDIPCRFGGEEFVVVMPDAALPDAVHRAETLRELVANQAVQHRGALLGTLTLSIGVASFPTHGVAPEEVLRAADAALYAAKKAGRNCVVVASEERLSGSLPPNHRHNRSAA